MKELLNENYPINKFHFYAEIIINSSSVYIKEIDHFEISSYKFQIHFVHVQKYVGKFFKLA